jgi:hypothetical protein
MRFPDITVFFQRIKKIAPAVAVGIDHANNKSVELTENFGNER